MEITLFKYVDILIGLALIMILVSPAVTAMTQIVLAVSLARPRFLQRGLEILITQIDAANLKAHAADIAKLVLRHPMIGKPPLLPFRQLKWRRGGVVEREELIRILLELAADEGPLASGVTNDVSFTAARAKLVGALKANGIADPSQRLKDIREAAQTLEQQSPTVAAHVRQMQAIIDKAKSDFVGKINNWFDQVMDRITQEYAQRARYITVVAALFVSVVIQLDSIDLVKRLAADDKLRASLVEQAKNEQARIDESLKSTTPPADANKRNTLDDELAMARARRDDIQANLTRLREPGLAFIPDHFIWERMPAARLQHARVTAIDVSKQPALELAAGVTTVAIQPRWATSEDRLTTIEQAINDLHVGVVACREHEGNSPAATSLLLLSLSAAASPIQLRLMVGQTSTNVLEAAASEWNWCLLEQQRLGILVSWMLLSLGAPFWYDALKNLLKLRSTLAQKEESQRQSRQKPAPGGGAPAATTGGAATETAGPGGRPGTKP